MVNKILYKIVIFYFYFIKSHQIEEIIKYHIICAINLSINVKILYQYLINKQRNLD